MKNSTVKEIAVYRNGCFIVREGTIELQAGKHSVILDCLDSAIDADSFSLSLPENIKGSNVQLEMLSDEEKEDILADIDTRLQEINNKINIKNKQIEMWNNNADFSSKDSLSIADMSEYIEKLPERLEKIYAQINELNDAKKKLEKERTEKMKQANSYQVKADIETKETGTYPFVLKYKDYRANWSALYEIHSSENDELTILLKAKINQYTDEDLKDVKISLFAADPNMSSDIPELRPLKLNFYSRQLFKAAGARMMASMATTDTDAEEMVEEAAPMFEGMAMNSVVAPTATSVKEDTMNKYELSGSYDITSNKEITLDLESRNIPCVYHVIAIPKLDDKGYLAAKVQVNDISDILQTNAIIYHNNTYIGEIYLDVNNDEESYDISLGRDELIKLNRKEKKKYTSNVLLKGTKKIDYEYEISISSLKDKPCKVTLYDQVPVSQDKTITVDIDQISRASLEEDTGKLTWEFDLNPQENKTFDLAYSVSYPKDKSINI